MHGREGLMLYRINLVKILEMGGNGIQNIKNLIKWHFFQYNLSSFTIFIKFEFLFIVIKLLRTLIFLTVLCAEAYLDPVQTFKMKCFSNTVNG